MSDTAIEFLDVNLQHQPILAAQHLPDGLAQPRHDFVEVETFGAPPGEKPEDAQTSG